jgi:hypothetical protein
MIHLLRHSTSYELSGLTKFIDFMNMHSLYYFN